MGEKPQHRMMSVDLGRRFMLSEQIWFDLDMVRSSDRIRKPTSDWLSTEKVKHTLCVHAVNAFHQHCNRMTPDDLLAHMWFHYGFLPCQYRFGKTFYQALVSVRGVCWLDGVPFKYLDTDGVWYTGLMKQIEGTLRDIRYLIRNEYQ